MFVPHGRVLVVLSDPRCRSDACAALEACGVDVSVGDPDDLVGLVGVVEADVVVVDGRPEEIVANLRRAHRGGVVLVTLPDAPAGTRARALAVGADDVVDPPVDVDELALRVANVLRHRMPSPIVVGDLVMDEAGHAVTRAGTEVGLTGTEFRLLLALARHPGVVLSKRWILQAVWGFDGFDVNLVEVHVSSLRRKLERLGPRIIRTVRAYGYVLDASVEGGRHHTSDLRSA